MRYLLSLSLCIMSRGILCTGSLDVIGHLCVWAWSESLVCVRCARDMRNSLLYKWQYGPKIAEIFRFAGSQEGAFF